MYKYRPEFSVGIDGLDDEHKKIFELTDEAYVLLSDENMLYKQEDLQNILAGINRYTQNHFEHEESYMESIHFDEIHLQKEQHAKFKQKLKEFEDMSQSVSLRNQDNVLLELLDYLVEWLERHIMQFDMKYKK